MLTTSLYCWSCCEHTGPLYCQDKNFAASSRKPACLQVWQIFIKYQLHIRTNLGPGDSKEPSPLSFQTQTINSQYTTKPRADWDNVD